MPEHVLVTQWGSGFLKGNFRLLRNTFGLAGQDSFTEAPAQNTDMFSKLINVQPPVQGDLERRWGYGIFGQGLVPTSVNRTVPIGLYQNIGTQTRQLVYPIGTQAIEATAEDGTSTATSIFAPTAQPCRLLNSRGYGYFSSGAPTDYIKWDGQPADGITNWGIATSDLPPALTFGPNFATGANSIPTGANNFWSDVGNVFATDGLWATVTTNSGTIGSGYYSSDKLYITGPNMSISPTTSNVAGIQIDVVVTALQPAGFAQAVFEAQLLQANVPYGNIKPSTLQDGGTPASPFYVPDTATTFTFGGPSDLWGGIWTADQLNDPFFGVSIQAFSTDLGTVDWGLDSVTFTVYMQSGSVQLGATAGGDINLSVGREYTLVFQNSTSGHVSDLNDFSESTGPLTNATQDLDTIAVSADPQVDTKLILATADGGDRTTLYYVATLPNATTTYTDTTPEETLLLNPIYLDQDSTGGVLGVADNHPPPAGAQFPINHRGRVYMATPNSLYYSKAEADLLTSSATLCGKYEESWPPLNYFELASQAETITGLLSDGQVLYIGTNSRVLRLYGDGPDTFQEPESLFTHVGVLNQDVWKMVFLQGNPLGAMWLTPDMRVVGSDFNTYQDIGQPIQDILDGLNPDITTKVAWASYAGISNWNLWILAVPTGESTQPDTLLIFDLKGKMWYIWQPTDNMLGGFYEVALNGVAQFLTYAASGKIYTWSADFTQDRVDDTPVDFDVTIESSWQDFTDAAARKYLNEIEVITGDPALTVTIEGASTKADFLSPHAVVASSALRVKPRGEYFVPLAAATTRDRYYRYRMVSSNSDASEVLSGINVQGGVIHRI